MPLNPYKVSESARQIARASGFDIDNPQQRYPVQNTRIAPLLNIKPQSRADQLLRGRNVLDRFLDRERS